MAEAYINPERDIQPRPRLTKIEGGKNQPMLGHDAPKLLRFEGSLPGDPEYPASAEAVNNIRERRGGRPFDSEKKGQPEEIEIEIETQPADNIAKQELKYSPAEQALRDQILELMRDFGGKVVPAHLAAQRLEWLQSFKGLSQIKDERDRVSKLDDIYRTGLILKDWILSEKIDETKIAKPAKSVAEQLVEYRAAQPKKTLWGSIKEKVGGWFSTTKPEKKRLTPEETEVAHLRKRQELAHKRQERAEKEWEQFRGSLVDALHLKDFNAATRALNLLSSLTEDRASLNERIQADSDLMAALKTAGLKTDVESITHELLNIFKASRAEVDKSARAKSGFKKEINPKVELITYLTNSVLEQIFNNFRQTPTGDEVDLGNGLKVPREKLRDFAEKMRLYSRGKNKNLLPQARELLLDSLETDRDKKAANE
ncbi:MAG: hypothetical protein WC480_02495 [Patescibacteria group bacterium]